MDTFLTPPQINGWNRKKRQLRGYEKTQKLFVGQRRASRNEDQPTWLGLYYANSDDSDRHIDIVLNHPNDIRALQRLVQGYVSDGVRVKLYISAKWDNPPAFMIVGREIIRVKVAQLKKERISARFVPMMEISDHAKNQWFALGGTIHNLANQLIPSRSVRFTDWSEVSWAKSQLTTKESYMQQHCAEEVFNITLHPITLPNGSSAYLVRSFYPKPGSKKKSLSCVSDILMPENFVTAA